MLKRIIYIAFCFFGCTSADTNSLDEKQPAPKPPQVDKTTLENIAYGQNKSHTLDIYFPQATKRNNKTIIYVHGGAWYAGDKTEATHWAKFFQDLGYTFVCINYRLTHTPENYIHPAQMHDIETAIEFIVKRSVEWEIQKDKLIIMGASAGGHLALLYAYKYNTDKKIKLCISLCGILDLTDKKLHQADLGDINGGTMISWFIGDTITRAFSEWKGASPMHNISATTVPTYFIHGKEDEIIPYQQSVKAHQILQRNNIASQLSKLDGVDHNLLDIHLDKEFNKVHAFIQQNLPD